MSLISKSDMKGDDDAYAVLCRADPTDHVSDGYFTTLAEAKRVAKLRVREGAKDVQIWKFVWSAK